MKAQTEFVPKLEVNGRPKVAEKSDGRWGDKIGSEAGKSGSRTKKEDGMKCRGRDWRTAIEWGTVLGIRETGGGSGQK